jgi:hypothetical protein
MTPVIRDPSLPKLAEIKQHVVILDRESVFFQHKPDRKIAELLSIEFTNEGLRTCARDCF